MKKCEKFSLARNFNLKFFAEKKSSSVHTFWDIRPVWIYIYNYLCICLSCSIFMCVCLCICISSSILVVWRIPMGSTYTRRICADRGNVTIPFRRITEMTPLQSRGRGSPIYNSTGACTCVPFHPRPVDATRRAKRAISSRTQFKPDNLVGHGTF
jgi:hypothetical protein